MGNEKQDEKREEVTKLEATVPHLIFPEGTVVEIVERSDLGYGGAVVDREVVPLVDVVAAPEAAEATIPEPQIPEATALEDVGPALATAAAFLWTFEALTPNEVKVSLASGRDPKEFIVARFGIAGFNLGVVPSTGEAQGAFVINIPAKLLKLQAQATRLVVHPEQALEQMVKQLAAAMGPSEVRLVLRRDAFQEPPLGFQINIRELLKSLGAPLPPENT